MAEWLPPDPEDRAYYEAQTRLHRRFAWAGVVGGVLLLALCGPEFLTNLGDGTDQLGFDHAWPAWGCFSGITFVGWALHHFWQNPRTGGRGGGVR